MKITQSTVALQSQHASALLRSQQSTLRAWVGNRRPDFEGQRSGVSVGVSAKVLLSAEGLARAHSQVASAAPASAKAVDEVDQAHDAVTNDPRLRLLMDMVEAITGRRVKVFDQRELKVAANVAVPASPSAGNTQAQTTANAPEGWGVELDSHETLTESETTRVSAQGVVHTADGKQINFTMQLEMSRAFVQESSTSLRAGDAVRKDPLVLNFDGAGVELADTQFAFDLNADGQTENIAFVTGGSGFLALDKNADGRINDGTELFGPRSGDGFTDLAQYDQDGNQWIDEGDAVYSQLRVWKRDANGNDQLQSLAQSGVGALYLGRVASPFSVNTTSNQTLGQVRSTGVFLYESGLAGSLQQVDL
ncbi:MAG: hypothetical protein FD135_3322 [Comamonadaceae bacterium]|nr:MAG: hypothetical protein FD135_3322 [Comamonadaceae bacterium]